MAPQPGDRGAGSATALAERYVRRGASRRAARPRRLAPPHRIGAAHRPEHRCRTRGNRSTCWGTPQADRVPGVFRLMLSRRAPAAASSARYPSSVDDRGATGHTVCRALVHCQDRQGVAAPAGTIAWSADRRSGPGLVGLLRRLSDTELALRPGTLHSGVVLIALRHRSSGGYVPRAKFHRDTIRRLRENFCRSAPAAKKGAGQSWRRCLLVGSSHRRIHATGCPLRRHPSGHHDRYLALVASRSLGAYPPALAAHG